MSSGLELKPPSEPPSLEGLDSEERVESMVEWFHSNFEDPAQETPYDGREGGYQYIWGGPYDAREELESVFAEASEDEIEAAVDEIQSDGLFEWSPSGNRIQPDDYIQGAGEEAWQNPVVFQNHVVGIAHTLANWAANLQLPF